MPSHFVLKKLICNATVVKLCEIIDMMVKEGLFSTEEVIELSGAALDHITVMERCKAAAMKRMGEDEAG